MTDAALRSALKDELACLERVTAVLHAEQDTLISARIDQLAEISAQKIRAISELEQLSAVRSALLQARNIPDDGSAISAWLGTHEPALLDTWETLIELARNAAQFNRGNGQLIASREEANRALMGILIAEHETESAYTADGRLTHSTPRRPLDRA